LDVLGRLTSRTVTGDAAAETFSYDAISRLTGHTSDLGSFTLGYLGQTSQITSRALTGTSLATSRGYSSNTGDRRLASLSTAGLSSGQYSTFNFTTNAENQITGQTQTSDASVAYPPSTLSQSASYNNLNQLTNLSGQSLSWDADGNLTSDGTRTYTWDAENRLAGISYASGEAISFVYDALGRRIQTSTTPAGGGTAAAIVQLWCGWKLCQTYTMINPLNAVLSKEYYAEGEYAPGSPAISSYYAPDQIGSVRRAFQTSGASPTYDYDPYGNPLQSTAPVTDFNYAGTFYNAASGLYLATRRPYDPVSGRWLSRDPIGEAGDPLGNLYAYVGGDPVDISDPSGRCPWCIAAIIGAGIGGGIEAWEQVHEYGRICSLGSVFAQAGIWGLAGATGFIGGEALEGASVALRLGYQAYNGAKFGLVSGAVGAAMDGLTGPAALQHIESTTIGGAVGGAVGEALGGDVAAVVGGSTGKSFGDVLGPVTGAVVDQGVEGLIPDSAEQSNNSK